MPFFVPRLIGPDGQLLPGGRYDFFDAGTTTPKAVYDAYGTALGSSVVVDGGASKLIYLGAGGYKIIAYDQFGVQVGLPADNIQGEGLGVDSTGTTAIVANYYALRNMTLDYDVVTVLGRETMNDGGEGVFYRSSSTLSDDDGVILMRGTTRYKRDFGDYIDPRWYGVVYNATADQTVQLDGAKAASLTWSTPVRSVGRIYVATDSDFAAGMSLINDGGSFASNSVGPRIRFLSGSRLIRCTANAFTANVQPVFSQGTVDAVRLSWMAGETTDAKIAKLIASATDLMTAIIDTRGLYSASIAFTDNWSVDPSEGLIDFDTPSPSSFQAKSVDTSRISGQVLKWRVLAYVGAVKFGAGPVRPEWFGAVGDGGADDSIPLQAAINTGSVLGNRGATYKAENLVTSGSVTFISNESANGSDCPAFRFNAGITASAGTALAGKNVTIRVGGGTLRAIRGDGLGLTVGSVALNGGFDLVNSSLTADAACTTDAVYAAKAKLTTFVAAQLLPTIRWNLTGCNVATSDKITVSAADSTVFGCRIVFAVAPGSRGRLNGCDVTNSTYWPTLTGGVYADAAGCRFRSTAGSPAEHSAWSNGIIWRFPMSDSTTVVTYSGCTQNGLPVWDPHAAAIDSVPVEYARGTMAAIPFASWHGLPAGVSAAGDTLLTGTPLDVTEPLENGAGWTTSGWHGMHSSFANDFGFALVSVSLAATGSGFVDLALATSPVYVNRADYPSSTWPPTSRLIREVTAKVGVRIMAGQTILVPVWIGAGDTVAAGTGSPGSGQVNARSTVTKLQAQIIRWSVAAGSTISVSIREGVVTEKSIFDAIYNKPDLTSVAPGASFEETGYPRRIDAVSYLGTGPKTPNGSAKLMLRGNDLQYIGGVFANSGTFFAWAPVSSSRLETIIGASYSRSPLTNVAPESPGAIVYRSGNPNGALICFDIDETTGFTGYRIISASNVVD